MSLGRWVGSCRAASHGQLECGAAFCIATTPGFRTDTPARRHEEQCKRRHEEAARRQAEEEAEAEQRREQLLATHGGGMRPTHGSTEQMNALLAVMEADGDYLHPPSGSPAAAPVALPGGALPLPAVKQEGQQQQATTGKAEQELQSEGMAELQPLQPSPPLVPPQGSGSGAACLAARAAEAKQRRMRQAEEAFQEADMDSAESMLCPLRLLAMVGHGGQLLQVRLHVAVPCCARAGPELVALPPTAASTTLSAATTAQDVVDRWPSYPLERQQEVFDAALVVASTQAWHELESRLRLALAP